MLDAPLWETETESSTPPLLFTLYGTLLTFSCPLCLILSYHISTATVLVVPNICFCLLPPPASSFFISFAFPIVLPNYISAAAVSIAPCFHHHTYPPSLSSSVSDFAVLSLTFSSSADSTIPHLCLHHPYCSTYLPRF